MDSEKLLQKAIDENLELEIKEVPDDREIRKIHVFSMTFENYMKNLRDRKKWRLPVRSMGILIAAVLCIGIFVIGMPQFGPAKNMSDSGAGSDMTAGTDESAKSGELEVKQESEADSADSSEHAKDSDDKSNELSGNQRPEYAEQVSIALDKEVYEADEVMTVTVGNVSDEFWSVTYLYEIEVYTEKGWEYMEPEEKKQAKGFMQLGPGEESMFEIDLADYIFDSEYEAYRIVKRIGASQVEAEFRLVQ